MERKIGIPYARHMHQSSEGGWMEGMKKEREEGIKERGMVTLVVLA